MLKQEEEILLLRKENAVLRKENAALQEERVALCEEVKQLKGAVKQLKETVEQLNSRVNKDSRNSSKPPSTDIRRTKSLRTSSGKPSGGQQGHKGTTLKMSETADKVIAHYVNTCQCCGNDLSVYHTHRYERRQVYDIPPTQMRITEHHAEIKQCVFCGAENKAVFPDPVPDAVQYGPHVKQLAVYLTQYQLLPYQRSADLIEDLTGHRISTGSLVNFTEGCSQKLGGFMEALKTHLQQSDVIHNDETGFRYEGKRKWLHVAATENSTFYMAHEKRGTNAMEAMGILTDYKGISVHDYWKSYLAYDCTHALCNAHHLRDLTFCHEQEKSEWAKQMIDFLLLLKQKVDEAKQQGKTNLETKECLSLAGQYDTLIQMGYVQHPIPEKPPNKRGKVKKTKTQNLLIRFDEHKEDILRFIHDFNVPFDNNLAERAIRMMRLKQKISGCFRSKAGAETFANIRSYIDTLRKNGIGIMESLAKAIEGNPCMVPFA